MDWDWVWAVLRCDSERFLRALASGAAMVRSLVEKGESGSALALLEVHYRHPISTMTTEAFSHGLTLYRHMQGGEADDDCAHPWFLGDFSTLVCA